MLELGKMVDRQDRLEKMIEQHEHEENTHDHALPSRSTDAYCTPASFAASTGSTPPCACAICCCLLSLLLCFFSCLFTFFSNVPAPL